MIKPFGNTTLADIFMEKLENINKISKYPFDDIVIGIYPGDKTLYEKSKSYNIKVIDRNEYSATIATKANEILSFLAPYNQTHLMWINATAPFLEIRTIVDIANFFKEKKNIESIHLVKDLKNWIWENNQRINVNDSSLTRVQEARPLLQSVHILHLYNRKFMMDTGAYWGMKENDPYLYKVEDGIEFLDIDTDLDFKICESIYERMYRKRE